MKSNKCLKWLCVKNVPAKFFELLSLNKSVEELFISSKLYTYVSVQT